MKEYIQSIVRHIMTIASGVIVVSEGETIQTALETFIGNIGNGDPKSLFSAGMILAVLVWSAVEKKEHAKIKASFVATQNK
jgi:hypothetical protein